MHGQRRERLNKIVAWGIAGIMVFTCGALDFNVARAATDQGMLNQTILSQGVTEQKPGSYKDGEVLVMFEDSGMMDKKDAKDELAAAAADNKAMTGFAVKKLWSFESAGVGNKTSRAFSAASKSAGFANVALLNTGGMSVKKAIRVLRKDDSIRCAEPNFRLHSCKVTGASDPYVDRQWGLDDVNVDSIWSKAKDTKYAVVAVVDSGVDFNHEELKSNMWTNPYISKGLKGEHGFNFINGSQEPMDDCGHGTHCAGIIAAAGNNDKGICGITGADGKGKTRKNLDIMALKILDEEGEGYAAEEVAAYNYINTAMKLGVNVVAINNSYGGGEYSEIMERLMTMVGEQGAISVCAAGNEGVDISTYADNYDEELYPVDYKSNYKIVVAATKSNPAGPSDELVSFSNYGKDSVDLAAPGTDILSTVSYDCYNPELYTAASGVNNAGLAGGVRASDFTCSNGVHMTSCKGINGSDTGIKFTAANTDDDIYAAYIDYTLDKTSFEEPPYCSMVTRADKAPEGSLFGSGAFAIFDTSRDVTIDDIVSTDEAGEHDMDYAVLGGKEDYWSHETAMCCTDIDGEAEQNISSQRRLWLVLERTESGNFEICIDHLGVSNSDKTDKFGKYDYYSGTSMACPHVTGAVALINAINQKNEDYEPLEVIGDLLSSTRASQKLEKYTATGGTLDFSQSRKVHVLNISDVLAGKGKIKIRGSRFDGFSKLKITIGGELVDPSLYSVTKNEIVISDRDSKWINDLADIEIVGTDGAETKTTKKEQVYLANDKKSFSKPEGIENGTTGVTTDGKKLYTTSSSKDKFFSMNPADGTEQKSLGKVTEGKMASWFDTYDNGEDCVADHDFVFGDQLIYLNGKLYTFGSYCEIGDNYAAGDDDWYSVSGKAAGSKAASEDVNLDEDDNEREKDNFEYFKETILLKANTANRKVSKVSMPKELQDMEDCTLAAYNGKLYAIGGFEYKVTEEPGEKPVVTGSFNRDVFVYSPATGKWKKEENAFPADRAGGKAIQSGNKLVYTLGYGKNGALNNIVFDGKTWTEKKASIEPYVPATKVFCAGEEYDLYSCGIGLCKNGIAYTGLNVKDYGDTFTYNISGDSFKDTGYNFRSEIPDKTDARATVIGSRVYCISQGDEMEELSHAKAVPTGLMKVTTSRTGKGSITGTRSYVPGTKVTVKVKAAKGYYVKSVRVGSKTYKFGKKIRTKKVTVSKAILKNIRVKAVFGKK